MRASHSNAPVRRVRLCGGVAKTEYALAAPERSTASSASRDRPYYPDGPCRRCGPRETTLRCPTAARLAALRGVARSSAEVPAAI